MSKLIAFFTALLAASACVKHNSAICESDADCTNPADPFCDINGQYPESNYSPNTCSPTPSDCPVEQCGCSAGAVLSCLGSAETQCGSDGMSTTVQSCTLGCGSDAMHCLAIEPSNGLGSALADASNQADVIIPAGSTIDTDLGLITTSAGMTITAKAVLVAQTSGPGIEAFEATSFVVDDAVVTGGNALALVASGQITIRGTLDAGAKTDKAGPGAVSAGASCVGQPGIVGPCTGGGGGGGNATAGAQGGGPQNGQPQGGALENGFAPLVGGCSGGNAMSGATVAGVGGAGGGAVQLVSDTNVLITGLINLGGGGGATVAGGGAGGLLVVEAPTVTMTGPGGVVSNGGSGGGCGLTGIDGPLSETAAILATCTTQGFAGHGGTAMIGPTEGGIVLTGESVCGPIMGPAWTSGGGGGAAGRVRIATTSGSFTSTNTPILDAAVSMDTLSLQ